jgi:ankyrin repeat domain-containing protein 50
VEDDFLLMTEEANTIHSSSVIKHLEQSHGPDPRTAMGYFYFSFSDSKKQSAVGMLESLIKQLCCHRPNTPQLVKDLSQYKEKGQRPNMGILEDALIATIHGFSEVYIIIDALDECPNSGGERKKLLECLKRIHKAGLKNLHLLCTSRRETDIEAALKPVFASPFTNSFDLSIYRDAIDRDIGLHIDNALASSDYESWPEGVKREARESLVAKADGM